MISAKMSYTKLNTEEVANKFLWMFEFIRRREIKYMRRDDSRCWKVGKEGISGYSLEK